MKWTSYHTKNIKHKYLYKFLSNTNAKRFLDSGHLWFSRADKFSDKMECVLIADLQSSPIDRDGIESRKRKTLISCWHLADQESLAMWDTYSKTKDERRVWAIRFELDDLNELVETAPSMFSEDDFIRNVYGRIAYKDLLSGEVLDGQKVKFSAFRKEKAFKYESEYRYVTQLRNEFNGDGFNYKLGDPEKLPFQILINPLLSAEQYSRLKKEVLTGIHSLKFEESRLVGWIKTEQW